MARRVGQFAKHLIPSSTAPAGVPAFVAKRNFQMIEVQPGITLRVVVEGEGPLVILLHGFPQGWYLWRKLIDPLVQAGYKVAVPDQRVYGGSSCPPEVKDYGVRNICLDCVNLAKALGQPRFLLIGHDFGCMMAWHVALLYPESVRAIIGMDVPYSRMPSKAPGKDGMPEPKPEDRFWYIREFQEVGRCEKQMDADLPRMLFKVYTAISHETPRGTCLKQLELPAGTPLGEILPMVQYPPEKWHSWLSEEDLAYYVTQFTPGTGATRGTYGPINWYRCIMEFAEVSKELGPDQLFEMPAMFLYGAMSDVTIYNSPAWQEKHGTFAELMKPWFKDLRVFEAVPNCGHWVPLEQPEIVNPKVINFLDSVKNLP